MESAIHGRELTELLEDAADGLPGALEAFFCALLDAEVYVPLAREGAQCQLPAVVGQSGAGDHGFVTVMHEGDECVPIFTEEAFVAEWAAQSIPVERKRFESLLWMISEDTWLYLNANQEVGKEITPWEIELLKKGRDAVPELAAAQSEHHPEEIEVNSDTAIYPELKRQLIAVLELVPELEEAFLVGIKQGAEEYERPVLGLKYRKSAPGKKEFIRAEIKALAEGDESGAASGIAVFDDLDQRTSPNHALFEDAKPFYFAKRPERKTLNAGAKVLSKVRAAFSGKEAENLRETKPEDEED